MAEHQTDLDSTFRHALDEHGFGFNYAVIKEVYRIVRERDLPWWFEQAEIPVTNRGHETRIDFVLQSSDSAYLVAECKKVNPAYGAWCFAGSKFFEHRQKLPRLLVEQIAIKNGEMSTYTQEVFAGQPPYPIALHVKLGTKKGDAHGDTKNIEHAVTQVLRGASGLVERLRAHYREADVAVPFPVPRLVVPVIFTTAQLYVTNADLASSDLATGSLHEGSFERKPYVWHQHHASESIRSDVPRLRTMAELGLTDSPFNSELFARSVAIVSVDGMSDFFLHLNDVLPSAFRRFPM